MEFTGDDDIGVRDFLRWMESWFVVLGEKFNGGTVESKKMRAAQIHVACPVQSVAGRFLQTLSDEILWDEDALVEALIAQFDDGDKDSQAQEDILFIMSTLRQGDDDVFSYSRRVLKLLQRRPGGFQHYDKTFIRYYVDGLASRRLREMAILNSLRADYRESPQQVVKGVMRFATRLKIKGYKKYISRDSDDDDDNDDDESSDTDDSSSDSGSDSDSYYRRSKKGKKPRKSDKSRKREKRSKSKERKSRKGQGNESSVRRELEELREMIQDFIKIQKAAITPNTGGVAIRLGNDMNPQDPYIVADGYERYPQPIRNPYGQRNTGYPNTRRPEYAHTGSHACYDNVHLKTGRIGPLARSDIWEPTRQQTNVPRFTRNPSIPPGSYSFLCSYERNPPSQPIVGPDGTLYYPSRELICFHCQELGHLDLQCPRLHDPALRTTLLRPEHPDTPVAIRKKPLAQTHRKPANAKWN